MAALFSFVTGSLISLGFMIFTAVPKAQAADITLVTKQIEKVSAPGVPITQCNMRLDGPIEAGDADNFKTRARDRREFVGRALRTAQKSRKGARILARTLLQNGSVAQGQFLLVTKIQATVLKCCSCICCTTCRKLVLRRNLFFTVHVFKQMDNVLCHAYRWKRTWSVPILPDFWNSGQYYAAAFPRPYAVFCADNLPVVKTVTLT